MLVIVCSAPNSERSLPCGPIPLVRFVGIGPIDCSGTHGRRQWIHDGYGCDAIIAQGYEAAGQMALTNLFSGRPTRGILNRMMREVGPMSDDAPVFPTAGGALTPLKAAAEARGSVEFASLRSGQAAPLGWKMGAAELTHSLAVAALTHINKLSQGD